MDAKEFGVGNVSNLKIRPRDEFSHKAYMIEVSDEDNLSAFSQICNKWVMLGNLGEDSTVRLYQKDITLLTDLFALAILYPNLRLAFKTFYYGWTGEIGITRAKNGNERDKQAEVNTMPGTGYGYEWEDARQREAEEANLFKRAFNRKKGG